MSKSKVVIVVCKDYDGDKVYKAISDGLNALGGISTFISHEEKILVKPNFLSPAEAEKVITTNPAVIKAVCRILSEQGYHNIKVGDSPAHGSCRSAFDKLNLNEGDLSGAVIADMSKEKLVSFPEGKTCKNFYYAEEVTEADAIIGLKRIVTNCRWGT